MKSISYSLIAAAAAVGIAFGQNTATTNPVGYVTAKLSQGFTAVGLTLQSPSLLNGDFESVSSNSVGDTDANFTTSLAAGSTYLLEIKSGTSAGSVHEIASWTATSLNTVDDLAARGVKADDTFTLRKAPTLEEIFGTTTSILKKGNTVTTADVIWIPAGNGTYNRYFINNAGAWRSSAGAAAPNVPLIYLDAFFIERKDAGTVDFVLSGEVKKSATVTVLATGFNLIGTLYPVGSTLQNFGLASTLTRGNTVNTADVVWVPNASGTYDRYFLNNLGVWRSSAGGDAPAVVNLTTGVFIERKAAGSVEVQYTPPADYSSL